MNVAFNPQAARQRAMMQGAPQPGTPPPMPGATQPPPAQQGFQMYQGQPGVVSQAPHQPPAPMQMPGAQRFTPPSRMPWGGPPQPPMAQQPPMAPQMRRTGQGGGYGPSQGMGGMAQPMQNMAGGGYGGNAAGQPAPWGMGGGQGGGWGGNMNGMGGQPGAYMPGNGAPPSFRMPPPAMQGTPQNGTQAASQAAMRAQAPQGYPSAPMAGPMGRGQMMQGAPNPMLEQLRRRMQAGGGAYGPMATTAGGPTALGNAL